MKHYQGFVITHVFAGEEIDFYITFMNYHNIPAGLISEQRARQVDEQSLSGQFIFHVKLGAITNIF